METIFKTYSLGASTNRDLVVYDFDRDRLLERVEKFCEDYNSEIERYKRKGRPKNVDDFLDYEKVVWSETLINKMKAGTYAEYDPDYTRQSCIEPTQRSGYIMILF